MKVPTKIRHPRLPGMVAICALAAATVGMAVTAQAEVPLKAVVLPAHVVACNNLKHARSFAQYTEIAPKFAADLLDRADCFHVKEPMEAVKLGAANGFTRLKLLSGHVVWAPTAKVKAANTPTR